MRKRTNTSKMIGAHRAKPQRWTAVKAKKRKR